MEMGKRATNAEMIPGESWGQSNEKMRICLGVIRLQVCSTASPVTFPRFCTLNHGDSCLLISERRVSVVPLCSRVRSFPHRSSRNRYGFILSPPF